ncbi:MAG: tRNA dihydrouridine synthase DusB [Oscillospiraceae bacterium]|jgi:tRNA-dihydrouridine synthase B|nr:tRNA dihydrouridine synthase DusB [Oscillospiraceae bacterium]
MKLLNVEISAVAALAPMAGVTDWAFRTVCREVAPVYTVTEMVSAKALCYQDKKSRQLLRLGGDEHPAAAQIFGSDPGCMAEGALRALDISGADVLDINMGCPTPKIVRNGDGCALMRSPELATNIVRTVVDAVKVPVTVKMRLGFDGGSLNAAEFAERLEQAGASGFCVHGRTGRQGYSGRADWSGIAKVVKAVSVPVIANGDIFSLSDLVRCLKVTGAAMGMIGRASMGNPCVFVPEGQTFRTDIARRHFELLVSDKGEKVACLEMRRHLAWYTRGLPFAAFFRREMNTLATPEDFARLLRRMDREGDPYG